MSKNIQDILLVSDLDGTLVTKEYYIPNINIEKLSDYVKMGGKFTIATGRSITTAQVYACKLPINAPAILYNGAMIYDFKTKEILWQAYISESAKNLCKLIVEHHPDVAVEIMHEDKIYIINRNDFVKIQAVDNLQFFEEIHSLDECPNEWNKVVLAADPLKMPELLEFIHSQNVTDIDYMFSCEHLYEFLPQNVNKGKSLELLAQIMGMDISDTFAIGDYDNDIELLQCAGFSAAPEECSDRAKQAADIIVARCEDGSVADYINYILKNKLEHK